MSGDVVCEVKCVGCEVKCWMVLGVRYFVLGVVGCEVLVLGCVGVRYSVLVGVVCEIEFVRWCWV